MYKYNTSIINCIPSYIHVLRYLAMVQNDLVECGIYILCYPFFNCLAYHLLRLTFNLLLIRKAVKELFDEDRHESKKQDISNVCWEDLPEDGYFGMYTHFSIHETMLKVVIQLLLFHL